MHKVWVPVAILACLCSAPTIFCRPAQAATYYFNATTGGTPGTGGAINVDVTPSVTGIVFGAGYATPLFVVPSGEFQPGDIIDFGTVTLYPAPISGDQYGDLGYGYDYFLQSSTGPLNVALGIEPGSIFSCNGYTDPNCSTQAQTAWNAADLSPIVMPLDFIVGTGPLDIQMAWAFASYSPPVELTATPVPATLPLFASGLGGLGLLRWRWRKRLRLTQSPRS